MKKRSQLLVMLAAMLCLPLLAMAPAAAEGGTDSGSGDSSSQTTTDSSTSGSGGDKTETEQQQPEKETETDSETSKTVGHLENEAKTLLETERKDGSKHSELARKTACKAHEVEINRRVNNYADAAQRHLDTFNSIFTKIQNFVTDKQLTVTNYDALVATAQSKQTAAQQAADALKALNVSIDCSQTDPAQSVATVKTAVANARVALQAYRSALKDLVTAIKGASTAHDQQSSTGGNQ